MVCRLTKAISTQLRRKERLSNNDEVKAGGRGCRAVCFLVPDKLMKENVTRNVSTVQGGLVARVRFESLRALALTKTARRSRGSRLGKAP